MIIDLYNTINRYDIIYSDPPWPQTKGNIRAVRPNQGKSLDYMTCSLEKIKEIHSKAFSCLNEKSNVFMWTIDKYLIETEQMLKELGFVIHARMIWDKGNGVAPAFTLRFAHEYLLWAYRPGHILLPSKEARGRYTTVIRESSTVHSHKPVYVYNMLDDMFPAVRKLELFARNQKTGWDSWGNQTEMFKKVE